MNTALAPWLPQFDAWTADGLTTPIARELVHKNRVENVLISRVAAVDTDHFAGQFRIRDDHPFFFEHPCDHVPGLAIIEGARQMGIAVCHLAYGVPVEGMAFTLRDLQASFSRYAELDAPLFAQLHVHGIRWKGERLMGMRCRGYVLQSRRLLGEIHGDWSILPAAVQARLRRSSR